MTDGYPVVPEALLDGWDERVREESTVFRLSTVSVVGHTVLYEDAALCEALERAGVADLLAEETSDDRIVETNSRGDYWRFVFATALTFSPPLTPGIGPASLRPTVVAEARRSFQGDLESRGFENVERGSSQRARTESGDRASLVKYTASYPFENAPTDALDVEGWLAVWSTGGSFRIAGGVYPTGGLDGLLAGLDEDERPPTDPNTYRDELLDLIRAVE